MPLQYSIAHLLNEITKTCNISYSKCVPSNGNMVLGENSVWFYPTLHRYPIQFRGCHSDKKARNPAARERKLNSVTFYRHDRASSWQHFYLLTLQLPWHAEVHKMIFLLHCACTDQWYHFCTLGSLYHSILLYTHMQLLKQLAWTGRWPHPIVHFIYSIMLLIWRSTRLKNLPHLLSKWLL